MISFINDMAIKLVILTISVSELKFESHQSCYWQDSFVNCQITNFRGNLNQTIQRNSWTFSRSCKTKAEWAKLGNELLGQGLKDRQALWAEIEMSPTMPWWAQLVYSHLLSFDASGLFSYRLSAYCTMPITRNKH